MHRTIEDDLQVPYFEVQYELEEWRAGLTVVGRGIGGNTREISNGGTPAAGCPDAGFVGLG